MKVVFRPLNKNIREVFLFSHLTARITRRLCLPHIIKKNRTEIEMALKTEQSDCKITGVTERVQFNRGTILFRNLCIDQNKSAIFRR